MKTLREGLQELSNALKPMNWKERIVHLWTYYKWVGFTVLVVAAGISIVYGAITAKDPLFSGATVNLVLTEDAQAYITDSWKDRLSDDSEEAVELIQMVDSDDTVMLGQDAVNTSLQISIMISAGELDYVLMDKAFLEKYAGMEAFSDLREILTEAQLEQLGSRVYNYAGDTSGYPMAVDISDTAFVQNCMAYVGAVYIAFPGNTERTELADDFLEYVLSWEKPLQQTP